jgi:CRP/FNR family transcriptional regulator, cyclic AMP receptor protein
MNRPLGKDLLVTPRSTSESDGFDVEAFATRYGGVTRIAFPPGAVIYRQADPPDCMYYLQQGQIQLKTASPKGKERILAVLNAGDFCGESCLIAGMPRLSTATCVTDCVLVRFETASVIRAVHEDAGFAEFYLGKVVSRIDRWSDRIISQLFDSSEQRLARVLLVMANYRGDGPKGTVIINNVGQETLAQMVGTTRARVSYFMNKFRKLGYIDYNGHIAVHGAQLSVVLK